MPGKPKPLATLFLQITLIPIFLLLLSPALLFANTCDLARDIATKAAKAFETDKEEGLRLFIMAGQMCPDDPVYAYNIAMAYYRYGRFSEAEKHLREAIAKDSSKPLWQVNLAELLMANNKAQDALSFARRAHELSPSAQTAAVLARARLLNGERWQGLQLIREARGRWTNENRLAAIYDELLDGYLAHYLSLFKSGKQAEGLAGLKRVDFDANALRAYCLALATADQLDEALATAHRASSRFPALAETFEELMSRKTRSFYEQFRAGSPGPAVQSARQLAAQYPQSKTAKNAEEELFNALVADAATISIPAASQASRPVAATAGRSEQLIAGLSAGVAPSSEEIDLRVGISVNIPQGRVSRPNGVAVVIGNQRYANQNRGINDVSFAERDAALMREYLIKTMGFKPENIIFQVNVSSGDFKTIFGSRENPRGRLHNYLRPGGESEVFIYYVGHGAPGADGGSSFLVPVDATADYIANTGYELDYFYQMLPRLDAKEVTVVIDSCFSGDSASGPLFTNISPAMVRSSRPARRVANTVVFASADQGQVSTWYPEKRHSLFTYFFLKGLSGAADQNKDNIITAAELEAYLAKEVPYYAQRLANRVQTPLVLGDTERVLTRFR